MPRPNPNTELAVLILQAHATKDAHLIDLSVERASPSNTSPSPKPKPAAS